MNVIGMRTKEARKAQKLTQAELATMMGVKKNTISAWETGQNRPGPDDIEKLCGFLHVSPSWLLGIDDDLAVSPDEMALVRKWRQLGESQRALILQMVDQLAEGGGRNGD